MRLKRNSAPTTFRPEPARPTIHQHAPNPALTIVALFICGIVGVPVGWYFLVYVFRQFGSRHPERDLATTIIVLIGLGIVTIAAKYFIAMLIEKWFDGQAQLKELDLQIIHQKQLASTIGYPAGRALEEDEKFSKLILAVMGEAYHHLATVGQYEHGDAKPWSWRQAINCHVNGVKVTEQMARRVRPWLTKHGVIRNDTVQIGKYKRLDDVRVLLDRIYNIPVAYGSASLPRGISDYEYIDENARMG